MSARTIFFHGVAVLAAASFATGGEAEFKRIVLDKTCRSEGVATGDVNRDGKPDIIIPNKKGVSIFMQEQQRHPKPSTTSTGETQT